MNYRIVASDLDGTLLSSLKEVSAENWQAIEQMHRQGVLFVPASGRAYEEMPPQIRECPLIRYYIGSDGGTVYDKQTDTFRELAMDYALGLEVLEKLLEYPVCLMVHADTKSYMDIRTHNEDHYKAFNMNRSWIDFAFEMETLVPDLVQFVREQPSIQLFVPFFRNMEDLQACKALLEKDPRLHVAQSYAYNLEISAAHAGKGNALRLLAESLDIPMDSVIAVGDSTNDLSMVTAAGLGLAMENAVPELKAAADQIACNNQSHIAQYILKNFLSIR